MGTGVEILNLPVDGCWWGGGFLEVVVLQITM